MQEHKNSAPFFDDGSSHWEDLGDGISRKILGWTDSLMGVCVKFDKDAIGAPHSHDIHDQIAYVVKGRFEIEIDGQRRELGPGDAFTVVKNTWHGARALEQDSMLIDMFSPKRDDFL
ncbi:cupin domain-containing protein [Phytohalomonas tamaricis]|uniref:cupin domain-containing protein n=1 Tax=Phytohalomonas tamaricis TaxID=2081032 RepID=UPI000D0B663D|nr:cupin domain-containing protein [Phytohalomonas tamaricis]